LLEIGKIHRAQRALGGAIILAKRRASSSTASVGFRTQPQSSAMDPCRPLPTASDSRKAASAKNGQRLAQPRLLPFGQASSQSASRMPSKRPQPPRVDRDRELLENRATRLRRRARLLTHASSHSPRHSESRRATTPANAPVPPRSNNARSRARTISRDPATSGVPMQPQDQLTHRFVPTPAMVEHQLLQHLRLAHHPDTDGASAYRASHAPPTPTVPPITPSLPGRSRAMKMIAHQPQAEPVQRRDPRALEQCQLLRQPHIPRPLNQPSSSRPRIRFRSSAAAASVNVTTSMRSMPTGCTGSSIRLRHRSTSVRVLPVPAPATTRTSPSPGRPPLFSGQALHDSAPSGTLPQHPVNSGSRDQCDRSRARRSDRRRSSSHADTDPPGSPRRRSGSHVPNAIGHAIQQPPNSALSIGSRQLP
jgi:hypothetical protein